MTLDQFGNNKERSSQELEKVILNADLSSLSGEQRVNYYMQVCNQYGLDAFTRPFEYIRLNNKLVLYATKSCASALQELKSISVEIVKQEQFQDVWIVTVRGTRANEKAADGRVIAENVGITPIKGLSGDALSNSIMKAVTKAQRRLVLQMAGLGQTDESEIQSIANTSSDNAVVRVEVDETGEIVNETPIQKEHDKVIKDFQNSPQHIEMDADKQNKMMTCWKHDVDWYTKPNTRQDEEEPVFRSHGLPDKPNGERGGFCQFTELLRLQVCEKLGVQLDEKEWAGNDLIKHFHNLVAEHHHMRKFRQITDLQKLQVVELFDRMSIASL